jgi:hypothetical protein
MWICLNGPNHFVNICGVQKRDIPKHDVPDAFSETELSQFSVVRSTIQICRANHPVDCTNFEMLHLHGSLIIHRHLAPRVLECASEE